MLTRLGLWERGRGDDARPTAAGRSRHTTSLVLGRPAGDGLATMALSGPLAAAAPALEGVISTINGPLAALEGVVGMAAGATPLVLGTALPPVQ